MIISELIRRVLNEQVNTVIQNLKDKYVGEGKPLTEKDFESILEASQNKFYLISWLTKKVGQGIIKAEDIYKYKEYFDLFEKNKKKFTHKDIHLYKTAEDLQKFLDEVINIREGDIVFDEIEGKDNFVSKNDIEKLQSTNGAKYLGVFDSGKYKYQVFQIFGVNQQTWKLYRDILGKCKGRSRGARIDICTIGNYHYFKNYLTDPKGSSYFVLYNLDDPKSPYQLHYESGQFMDKNDNSITGIDQLKFFEFISDRVPQYSLEREDFPGEFEIPVKGKGIKDEKGRKQGLWKSFEGGKVRNIQNYVNDREEGFFVHYYLTGKIHSKGSYSRGGMKDGPFELYHENGKIDRKGTYNQGTKIGLWVKGTYDGPFFMVDYDKNPEEISGFTASNKLRFVSDGFDGTPRGNVVFFNPSGTVAAMGRFGVDLKKLGDWVYYFPDGSIRAEGLFLRGKRSGKWVDVFETDKGRVIFESDFLNGRLVDKKTKVYDAKGKYIKKLKYNKIPKAFWENHFISLDSFRN